jgi:ADP-ribosylglycohydrolase
MRELTFRDRILGGLWGAVIGDALGVPVEFQSRAEMRENPVTGLRGHGTHGQPKRTWSDDSSLMLSTVDSLLRCGFDLGDMGRRFVEWSLGKLWTPWGSVFDIGGVTSRALSRIEQGVAPEQAGFTDEHSNGNGSLMRILPIALRFRNEPAARLLEFAGRASAITHGHPRSQMACGFYCLVAAGLLRGQSAEVAHKSAVETISPLFKEQPWALERHHFAAALSPRLATVAERDIASGGHVVETLTASLWCLLTSKDYSETVLKGVNLGEDTDTTGTVAGGLAGIRYGLAAVPVEWRTAMARAKDLEILFEQFAVACGTG